MPPLPAASPAGVIRKQLASFAKFVAECDDLDQDQKDGFAPGLAALKDRLDRPIRLSFIGNFSTGKSRIINSLLGEDIAPVDVGKATAAICHFRYGDTVRVRFHYKDEHVEEGDLFAFKRFADHGKLGPDEVARIKKMSHVEIFYPSEALRDMTLVDTPGFGSDAEQDDDVTRAHLRDADAVCWVFDATNGGCQRDEAERISELKGNFHAAFAVVNKCDRIPPGDRPDFQAQVLEAVPGVFEDVLLYSADTVIRLHEGDSTVDDDDSEHVCLDLKAEIERRVRGRSIEIAATRVWEGLRVLAGDVRDIGAKAQDESAQVIEFLQGPCAAYFDRADAALLDDLKAGSKRLRAKLRSVAKQGAKGLGAAVGIETGWFSDTVALREGRLERALNVVDDGVDAAFREWQDCLVAASRKHAGEIGAFLHGQPEPVSEWAVVVADSGADAADFAYMLSIANLATAPWRLVKGACVALYRLIDWFEKDAAVLRSVADDNHEKLAYWLLIDQATTEIDELLSLTGDDRQHAYYTEVCRKDANRAAQIVAQVRDSARGLQDIMAAVADQERSDGPSEVSCPQCKTVSTRWAGIAATCQGCNADLPPWATRVAPETSTTSENDAEHAVADKATPKRERQSEVDVLILDHGPNKIQVIKVIREIAGVGPREAKDIAETLCGVVKRAVSATEARAIKKKLDAAGAKVSIVH